MSAKTKGLKTKESNWTLGNIRQIREDLIPIASTSHAIRPLGPDMLTANIHEN